MPTNKYGVNERVRQWPVCDLIVITYSAKNHQWILILFVEGLGVTEYLQSLKKISSLISYGLQKKFIVKKFGGYSLTR